MIELIFVVDDAMMSAQIVRLDPFQNKCTCWECQDYLHCTIAQLIEIGGES